MATLFLQYPACSTCQKAKKWLTENNIEFTNRLIVEENPTAEELKAWIPRSGLPVKKFFNTSGLVYKELKLSEKLPAMSEEEQIALLATNGKLVKRPLVVTDSFVLVGFKPDEWGKIKIIQNLFTRMFGDSEVSTAFAAANTGVAQLVEHRSPKPGVGSSSLSSRAELNSCKR